MKKKIPFSLEYRDKIESGEVEVVTRDDRHVDILKWDAKNSKYPIIGTIDKEGSEEPYNWTATGKSIDSVKKNLLTYSFLLRKSLPHLKVLLWKH